MDSAASRPCATADTVRSSPPRMQSPPAHTFGIEVSHAAVSNVELIIFGSLIIFFLIVEPHGLARLWQITKEKLRLWPFPH